jgi:hypothetical protein
LAFFILALEVERMLGWMRSMEVMVSQVLSVLAMIGKKVTSCPSSVRLRAACFACTPNG